MYYPTIAEVDRAHMFTSSIDEIIPKTETEAVGSTALAVWAGGPLGGTAACTTIPFANSNADVLQNNVIINRKNPYIMEVDNNQPEGGNITTQLEVSSSLLTLDGNTPQGVVANYDLICYNVAATATSGLGVNGTFDIFFSATYNPPFLRVDAIKASSDNGNSSGYVPGDILVFTAANINASSTS